MGKEAFALLVLQGSEGKEDCLEMVRPYTAGASNLPEQASTVAGAQRSVTTFTHLPSH